MSHSTHTPVLWPFFQDYPGKPVPLVQGKIYRGRHTDHPAGRHSISTNQRPPPSSSHFYAGCPSCRNPPTLFWHGTGTKHARLHTQWHGCIPSGVVPTQHIICNFGDKQFVWTDSLKLIAFRQWCFECVSSFGHCTVFTPIFLCLFVSSLTQKVTGEFSLYLGTTLIMDDRSVDLVMVALWNRADHYIFILFLSSFFLLLFLFPRLISAVRDWMSTILPHKVWP